MPQHQVSVRKTFNLNRPGCSVNCTYCTCAKKYTKQWNENRIIDNIEEKILNFHSKFPTHNIELVGYWYGPPSNQSKEYQRLISLSKDIVRSSNSTILGGDLGIISDTQTMYDLKNNGFTYIHCNLETSRRLYPVAIGRTTSRLYKKINTLENAHKSGLAITSGILIGLGENISDLIETTDMLRRLPINRVAVNFMDYDTDQKVGEIFSHVRKQLTPEYALRTLIFLRNHIRPNQSLMVGSGVGRYMYDETTFPKLLSIVDTIHLGSFINLMDGQDNRTLNEEEIDSQKSNKLINKLERLKYSIVPPNYFK